MQRILSSIILLLTGTALFSQTTKTTSTQKTTVQKPVVQSIFKDLRDSASYTAGIHIVNKYGSQNIYNFNSLAVARAINDLQSNKPQLISNQDADDAVRNYQMQLMSNPKLTHTNPSTGVTLNNLCDSASYAAGIYLINFFREFDIVNFNSTIVSRAINDLQSKKKPLLSDSMANMVALRYQFRLQEIKNKPTIDAGKKFLAENKKKQGVKVTPSGLQYEVIKQGTGRKPTKKDTVSCNYIGAYIDGTEFNNSYNMGGPVTFAVGGVIKGWTEGLQMMPVGSKWKLYIPYTLGYGPGPYNAIPGGSALVFEIELLDIVNKR